MIAAALEAEVASYIERFRSERGEDGRASVVRNGRGRPRQVTLGSGTVTIEAPRVNDKRVVDGERQKFTSAILPPYLRRSQKRVGALAVAVSARTVDGRLPPCVANLARRERIGSVGERDHAPGLHVVRGALDVEGANAGRSRLRVRVG
jgi:hypothetical protein